MRAIRLRRWLFYQDFNEQFEGYTQLSPSIRGPKECCFIRISMNNLKDIHNPPERYKLPGKLFYQDFNEQFEGYTQPVVRNPPASERCFIRISMNNLKDIHNRLVCCKAGPQVVLSGFQ